MVFITLPNPRDANSKQSDWFPRRLYKQTTRTTQSLYIEKTKQEKFKPAVSAAEIIFLLRKRIRVSIHIFEFASSAGWHAVLVNACSYMGMHFSHFLLSKSLYKNTVILSVWDLRNLFDIALFNIV